MPDLDLVVLSRVQFAVTIMFHYLFPPLSIGLGLVMVVLEAMALRTGDRAWESMARFWTRIFAVNFAVGVATGIVMEFEFGTNWSTYSRFVGDVFGSALAAEGIFAFFLESGFLAVLVFGWDRVGPRMHFFATLMVFLGSVFSSVWIVIANSWQQTPAGHVLAEHDGVLRAEIVDFWAMVFNPSSMHRLGHVLLGAFILGGFFVMSISAWYILQRRHEWFAKRSFVVGLAVALVASWGELLSGHAQASMVAEHQPAKLAAFEGHFRTGTGGTPLYVVGWPDEEAETVRYGVPIDGMLSYLIYEDFVTPVPGLDRTPPDERPPVLVPFVTYHTMVALGMAFIGLTTLATLLLWRRRLFSQRWLLWVFVFAVVGPYVANETGWVSAEVGRQPWVVYGLLRTEDAVSRAVPTEHVLGSLVLFSLVYLALFALWAFVINEKIRKGPDEPGALPPRGESTGKAGESMMRAAVQSRRSPLGRDLVAAERGPSEVEHEHEQEHEHEPGGRH